MASFSLPSCLFFPSFFLTFSIYMYICQKRGDETNSLPPLSDGKFPPDDALVKWGRADGEKKSDASILKRPRSVRSGGAPVLPLLLFSLLMAQRPKVGCGCCVLRGVFAGAHPSEQDSVLGLFIGAPRMARPKLLLLLLARRQCQLCVTLLLI